MVSIVKAGKKDAALLSGIAQTTFLESHGHSAKPEDVNKYVQEKYNEVVLKQELSDPENIFHIIYQNNIPAGFSKIIFNFPYTGSPLVHITKLERIYLLKEFHDLKLGLKLFQFNVELSKQNDQVGIWLYVWIENERAIHFYKKAGFIISGSYDFKISETHSNPNYLMFLEY